MPVILGCIADDFTGATDLASALTERGHAVTQILGVPSGELPADADVVIVALSLAVSSAAAQARQQVGQAAHWFSENGVDRMFSKYRHTFDCPPDDRTAGNIGLVADELLSRSDARLAVHAPSHPGRGQTVYQGHLFAGSRLLSEVDAEESDRSGRRPLTPRCDPDLVRVLRRQTAQRVALVALPVVAAGPYAIAERLSELARGGVIHVIVDAVTDGDLDSLAAGCCDGPVLAAGGTTFGAAYGAALALIQQGRLAAAFLSPAARAEAVQRESQHYPVPPGGHAVVLVAGPAQRAADQVAAFEGRHPVYRLSPEDLRFDRNGALDVVGWAQDRLSDGPVMIVLDSQPTGTIQRIGEQALGQAARRLVSLGVGRLVVAGAGISNAVTSALGITRLRIGPAIAPGIPWMVSENPDLAMVLTSGEVGSPTLFEDAFALIGDPDWHPAG